MTSLRRLLIASCAAFAVAFGSAGCAASSINSQINHVSTHAHISLVQAGWCAYHVSRLDADFRHHHLGWATFQAVLAAHHCARVIRH